MKDADRIAKGFERASSCVLDFAFAVESAGFVQAKLGGGSHIGSVVHVPGGLPDEDFDHAITTTLAATTSSAVLGM